VKHDTTAACQQGEAEQMYIISKCGHSILPWHSNCWTHCNALDTLKCWKQ